MEEFIISWLKDNGFKYSKIESYESVKKIYDLLTNNIIFNPQNGIEILCLATYYLINKKYDLAEKYYKMVADCGTASEIYKLAKMYYDINKYDLAEKYYLMAIEKGNNVAMNSLGVFYETIKKNNELAKKYYEMAVDYGNACALHNLAGIYRDAKNYDLAEKYFLMAIEQDIVYAMNSYGIFCENIKKNYELAEKYYKMALDQDSIEAINNLGSLYYKTRKYDLAEKYFLMAAEKDCVESLHNLATYHQFVTKNDVLLEKYYLMAINLGYLNSLKSLSEFYKSSPTYDDKLLDLYYKYISLDETFRYELNNVISKSNDFFKLLKYKDCLDEHNKKRFNQMLILIDEQKDIISQEIVILDCVNCKKSQKCVPYGCGHFQCFDCFDNDVDCRVCKNNL